MPDFKRYRYSQNYKMTVLKILTRASREFGLDNLSKSAAADLSGNLVTTMQAGAIAGALISGPLADRKGRKPALLAVAVAGFCGGLMQGLSFGYLPVFYIGRYEIGGIQELWIIY